MVTNTPRDTGSLARYAVIDVGTNSVKLLVAERAGDGSWITIRDRADLTRLGEGLVERGEISPAATARTAEAIAAMVADATADGVLAIAAVGTAAFRTARNRDAVVAAIAGPDRHPGRGHLGRGGEPPGVSRGQGRRRAGGGRPGGVRHGRREHAADVRPRGPGGRALQRRRRRGALHGTVRAGPRGGRRDPRGGAGRDLRRPRTPRPAPPGGRAGGDGRRHHQHRGGEPWPRDLRPGHRPGHRPRAAPRSTARWSSTARATSRPAAGSSASSPRARTSSWPGPASCARSWTSWAGTRSPSATVASVTACSTSGSGQSQPRPGRGWPADPTGSRRAGRCERVTLSMPRVAGPRLREVQSSLW